MFTIDERLGGLPAVKEQVVQLYQSLNAAPPGGARAAGRARRRRYVLGPRGPNGFAVFVYLYMPDSGECAVYVPSNGTVAAEQYQAEEGEALSFVESMGFIMDNLNFRGRPGRRAGRAHPDPAGVPARAAPRSVSSDIPGVPASISGVTRSPTGRAQGVVTLGKLFSAFCLLLASGLRARQRARREQGADPLRAGVAEPGEEPAVGDARDRGGPEAQPRARRGLALPRRSSTPLLRAARRGPEVLHEGPRAQARFSRRCTPTWATCTWTRSATTTPSPSTRWR